MSEISDDKIASRTEFTCIFRATEGDCGPREFFPRAPENAETFRRSPRPWRATVSLKTLSPRPKRQRASRSDPPFDAGVIGEQIGPDIMGAEAGQGGDMPDMARGHPAPLPVENSRASDFQRARSSRAAPKLVDGAARGLFVLAAMKDCAHAVQYRKTAQPNKKEFLPPASGGGGDDDDGPLGPSMLRPVLPEQDFHRLAAFRLRLVIDTLKMTQAEAARIMGVSRGVLRNWLAGDNAIQTYNLYIFSLATGVTFDFVYRDDTSHLPSPLREAVDVEVQARLARLLEANPESSKNKSSEARHRKD